MKRLFQFALVLLLAAAPGCSPSLFCAPCPACGPAVAAAPAEEAPRVAPAVPAPPAAPAAPDAAATTAAAATKGEPDAGAPEKVEVAAQRPKADPPLPNGRVRNAKEYFATLKHRFVPSASKGLHAVFQFDLSGAEPVAYHVAVDDGAMKLEKGKVEKADVTIAASSEDYIKVVNGEMGGAGAVLSRKMKVGGDLTLARKMEQLFPGGHQDK